MQPCSPPLLMNEHDKFSPRIIIRKLTIHGMAKLPILSKRTPWAHKAAGSTPASHCKWRAQSNAGRWGWLARCSISPTLRCRLQRSPRRLVRKHRAPILMSSRPTIPFSTGGRCGVDRGRLARPTPDGDPKAGGGESGAGWSAWHVVNVHLQKPEGLRGLVLSCSFEVMIPPRCNWESDDPIATSNCTNSFGLGLVSWTELAAFRRNTPTVGFLVENL